MPSSTRWRAPGRVNLIGEHTDYNDGFVLPLAIPHGCTAEAVRTDEAELVVSSAQKDRPVRFDLADVRPDPEAGWAGYVAGVVRALQHTGIDVPGMRISVDSDVPPGSGLSSSAALTCSVATAVDDLLDLGLDRGALLAVTRSAENDFVGAPTGGMDQLASLNCTAGHALFCDMRSLRFEQVPLDLAGEGLVLLVIDTRAEHRHSDGEYGRRRQGCERAAADLGVSALRDLPDLEPALNRLEDDELRRYVRHVLTENQRVLDAVTLLRDKRVRDIGPLLSASHASLRDDYRVSAPELDVAVESAEGSGALGARMTGGGFGGAAIALVDEDDLGAVTEAVTEAFAARGFAEPRTFAVLPSDGAHRLP
jgi:galactokinase